jgi:hypothetical protein
MDTPVAANTAQQGKRVYNKHLHRLLSRPVAPLHCYWKAGGFAVTQEFYFLANLMKGLKSVIHMTSLDASDDDVLLLLLLLL